MTSRPFHGTEPWPRCTAALQQTALPCGTSDRSDQDWRGLTWDRASAARARAHPWPSWPVPALGGRRCTRSALWNDGPWYLPGGRSEAGRRPSWWGRRWPRGTSRNGRFDPDPASTVALGGPQIAPPLAARARWLPGSAGCRDTHFGGGTSRT